MSSERLQKIIAAAGVTSRRKAEELITSGRVIVNGNVITELGTKADPETDHIRVDGKLIEGPERFTYLMLNKPKGYVTTVSDEKKRPTVMDLVAKVKGRVYPVGRLDWASEGLLLMTNDGALANGLMKAASNVAKVYVVKVAGQPDEAKLDKLRVGVSIAEKGGRRVRTAPAKIRLVREGDNPWLEVTIVEGRNRQVRKMFEEVGHHVEKIRRVQYGPLALDVPPGDYRNLTLLEVSKLKAAAAGQKVASPPSPDIKLLSTKTVPVKPAYISKPTSASKPSRSERPSFGGRSFDRKSSGGKSFERKSAGGRSAFGKPSDTPRTSSDRPAFGQRSGKPSFSGSGSGKPAFGARAPRPAGSDKPSFAKRTGKPAFKGKSSFAGKPSFGARPARPSQSDKPSFANRSGKPSFGGKPSFSGKPSFGARPSRPALSDKPAFGQRSGKPFSGKPSFSGRPSSARPSAGRPSGKPSFKSSSAKGPGRPSFESRSPRTSQSDKPSFAKRPGKPSFSGKSSFAPRSSGSSSRPSSSGRSSSGKPFRGPKRERE